MASLCPFAPSQFAALVALAAVIAHARARVHSSVRLRVSAARFDLVYVSDAACASGGRRAV
ncbi:exported protein of unknown function [Paraburkholderia kururiensis]